MVIIVYLSLIREYDDKHVCIYENREVFGNKSKAEDYQKEDFVERIKSPGTSWSSEDPHIVRYPQGHYVRYDLEEYQVKE